MSKLIISKNIVIPGKHHKPILVDVFCAKNDDRKPIIIFCHGYKGFKDWGAWNLMAKTFAEVGFLFVKFNFSYNGGTIDQPVDFPDLEAFGNNNYSKELDDLESVIDWISHNHEFKKEVDVNNITLIGHSRAGGIVLIKAEEDSRIHSVISLAGVSNFENRTSTTGELERWKKEGVKYIINGRTKQKMPHYYQFYEDFIANKSRLSIKRAATNLKVPNLIIHGERDTSIAIEEARTLHAWNSQSELKIIEDANHVFGASHPWEQSILPLPLQTAAHYMITFIKSNIRQK